MGPAPRWCSFLDNITEEIEESAVTAIYDDYKFITKDELIDLGLDHLVGTSLLRAYMHGYFMDARLYRKAHSVAQPYTLDKFMSDKINKKLDQEQAKRVQLKSNLPKTNKEVFLKLKDQESDGKKKKQREVASNLLGDDRFKSLFTDDRFQVDQNDEAFRLLNPVLTKLDETKAKSIETKLSAGPFLNSDQEDEGDNKESDFDDDSDESSDDEHEWTQKVKEVHKALNQEAYERRKAEKQEKQAAKIAKTIQYDMQEKEMNPKKRGSKKSLADRLDSEVSTERIERKDYHQMVFREKKSRKQLQQEEDNRRHRQERQEVRRSASGLKKDRIKPKFFRGKRVI